MYVLYKKRKSSFKVGDILRCWDEELNRSITGYILSVATNKQLNDYDVHIRWDDPFVAVQVARSTQMLNFIRKGLWKYYNITIP